jgi:hypothetical protein
LPPGGERKPQAIVRGSGGPCFQRLWDKLSPHRENIIVAYAKRVKCLPGHKSGKNDGPWLAGLGIRGMIKPMPRADGRDAAEERVPPGPRGMREGQPGPERQAEQKACPQRNHLLIGWHQTAE